MKVISLLLAITLAAADAAPSDPGKVALEFLETVRRGQLNLEPGGDTALSSGTAEEKRHQIARRWDRLARDLGSDPLEVGEVKLDDNYAGVLVRKTGGFDPSRLQVFPIALVKRGADWRVAPVPASFENAGAGYAIALKKRLETLENWMLREQVTDLEQLRKQSAERMRQKIEARLTAKELRGLNARQVGERFMAACEAKDLASVLGLLGGLAAERPNDWPTRLKAADRAMKTGAEAVHPWHLLTAPEVARVLLQSEEHGKRAAVSLACLDPAGNVEAATAPRVRAINLDLVKGEDGLWQVNPPANFLQEEEEAADDADEELDLELINLFPKKWRQAHPPTPQATAEQARQALAAGLSARSLEPLLAMAEFEPAPEAARASCSRAAQLWWLIHAPSAVRQAVPLDFKEEATAAVGVFQFFSARDPELWEPRVFYFEKTQAGWLWTPFPGSEALAKFKDWVDSSTQHWQDEWQQALFAEVPRLAKIDVQQAPTADEARKCVEEWLTATRQGEFQAALRLITRLGDETSGSFALRNLGYDITGAGKNAENPTITPAKRAIRSIRSSRLRRGRGSSLRSTCSRRETVAGIS